MMRKIFLSIILVCLFAFPCFSQVVEMTVSAGTASSNPPKQYNFGPYQYIEIGITSNSSGAFTATFNDNLGGEILLVASNPGATSPSANWDFVWNRPDGVDACEGGGANRSATNNETFTPQVASTETGSASKPAIYSPSYIVPRSVLKCTDMGDSKVATISVVLRRSN